jgi:hypothetical protein
MYQFCPMIPRQSKPYLQEVYKHFPVVFLTGPRQSGKTTLAREMFANMPYVLLELPDQQRLAREDPRSFLMKYPAGAILDEVQNVPELFSYLQGIVDEDREVRFVLTGSQNFLLNEKITQSLAGRAGIVTLLPLSLQELSDKIPGTQFEEWIVRGFYPELFNRNVPSGLFYPGYVQTYLERDVRSLQNVGNLSQFSLFLRLCAGRAGQIINLSALSAEAGVSVNTCKAWLSVLEASYIVFRLQPHYRNYNKRLVKSPKLYFNDTGLVCHLLGIERPAQLATHYALGALFENFVVAECYKQRLARGKQAGLYFWKDSKGIEVDLLVEDGDDLRAYEIKAGRTVNPSFFQNLIYWKKLGGRATKSTIIYGGDLTTTTPSAELMSWNDLISEF